MIDFVLYLFNSTVTFTATLEYKHSVHFCFEMELQKTYYTENKTKLG